MPVEDMLTFFRTTKNRDPAAGIRNLNGIARIDDVLVALTRAKRCGHGNARTASGWGGISGTSQTARGRNLIGILAFQRTR